MNPDSTFDQEDLLMMPAWGTVYQDPEPNLQAADAHSMSSLVTLDTVPLDLGEPFEIEGECFMDAFLGDLTQPNVNCMAGGVGVRDDTGSYFDFNWEATPTPSQQQQEVAQNATVDVDITAPQLVLVGQVEAVKKEEEKEVTSETKGKVIAVSQEKGKREARSSQSSKCSAIIQTAEDFIVSSDNKVGSGKGQLNPRKKVKAEDKGAGKMVLDPKLLQTRRPMKKPVSRNPTPEEKKDENYFAFRRRNTESAKRCREKKRALEEQQVETLRAAHQKIAQLEIKIEKLKRKLAVLTQMVSAKKNR